MKKLILISLFTLLAFPLSTFAINAPTVDEPPSSVDADYYTLTIYTEPGAKISVVGGPSQLAPVTDGIGIDEEEDGVVEFMVGLAQETVNTFSITAEVNGNTSDSVIISVNETSGGFSSGDTTPPDVPILNEIPEFVDAITYIITGEAEPDANVNARTTDGELVGSGQTNEDGFFQITVPLEEFQTNRFNISAEDEFGNESSAVQALIRHSVDLEGEQEVELVTSAQVFFEDTDGHWAEDYINDLYEQEVVSGKEEGIFDPNGYITRAELTKIAMLAFGHSVNTNVNEHPFSDVPMNSWFAPYVEEAKRLGVVEGYPSGGFGPNDYITRAAALKIIIESAGYAVIGAIEHFPDVPVNAWYSSYVTFAYENDIVGGYEDGTFGPANYITRAQVAKIVVKVLEME
ncbi:S-layer homology domain-containing protein [Patescibacteria group bacterium]|nr:S-layer homology domain-containing protein [Patescibacteria group bacterium]